MESEKYYNKLVWNGGGATLEEDVTIIRSDTPLTPEELEETREVVGKIIDKYFTIRFGSRSRLLPVNNK